MALLQPPSFIQARNDHKAQHDRLALGGLILASGVRRVGDLKVSAQGSPNMTVQVAAGGCYIIGTENNHQGVYHCYQDTSTASVTIAASSPTLPRKDIIVARVYDAAYSGASNLWAIERVGGTAAASPVEPALPANSYKLATIDIAANATTVTNANITDRTFPARAGLPGGLILCTSSTRPTNVQAGDEIYETDTGARGIYTGTTWRFWDTEWKAFTPTWVASGGGSPTPGSGGGAYLGGRYTREGSTVHAQGGMVVGTAANGGSGVWEFGVPLPGDVSLSPNLNQVGTWWWLKGGNYGFGAVHLTSDGLRVQLVIPGTATVIGSAIPSAWALGEQLRWELTYEMV